MSSDGLRLSAFLRLSVAPGIGEVGISYLLDNNRSIRLLLTLTRINNDSLQSVRRRRVYSWNPQQVTAELGKTQVSGVL